MKKRIDWVFLVLENPEKELLVITENNENNRPRKNHGQYSVPAWTIEKSESIEKTIHREFEEETGLNWLTTIVEETLEEIGMVLLETEDYELHGRVYKGKIPMATEDKVRNFSSEEVGQVQVLHPEALLAKSIEELRPGLLEVLLLHKGIQPQTVYIENWEYKDKSWAHTNIAKLKELYNNETPCY